MSAHFAEVLSRETDHLVAVSDTKALAAWRRRLIEELMSPRSPYVEVLRHAGDEHDRAEFLDRWCELITATVGRVARARVGRGMRRSSDRDSGAEVDPQKTAVLILAALHGGGILSHLAKDPGPLSAALDLALISLVPAESDGLTKIRTR